MPLLLTKRISLALALVLLLFQFGMQVHLAKVDAETTDEGIHLFAGYTYLTRHILDFNSEHPPLVKTLAALPLLVLKPNQPPDSPYWDKAQNFFYHGATEHRQLGEAFLYQSGNNADQVLFWGRVPMAGLTLLLGLTIYLASVRFWGWWAGLVSLSLYVFDPTMTAHGHLVTTDIGVSLGVLLTVLAFWRLLHRPVWHSAVLFGLALAVALLAKFTSIIVLPLLVLTGIWFMWRHQSKPARRAFGRNLLLGLVVAWLMMVVVYQFQVKPAPPVTNLVATVQSVNSLRETVSSQAAGPITAVYNVVRYVAIPRDYVKGVLLLLAHVGSGQRAFLLGQTAVTGWWYYFPVLFLAKTPWPTLAILVAGVVVAVRQRKESPVGLYLFLVGLGYLAFAMTSRANIGVRHILPIYPLLFIVAGSVVAQKSKIISVGLPSAMIGLLVLGFAATYPYYLSYFNPLFGGTPNGYRVATDSNLEWGQDLKRIKAYVEAHNIQNPYLEYYWDGLSSPDYYGLKHRYLTDYQSGNPGYAIIGVTDLQTERFAWLKNYQPIDRITPSVFVYKLD